MLMVPIEDRMSADEQAGIALPASRILLRHVKILGRIPEDVIDGYAILTILISWRIRVSSEHRAKAGGVDGAAEAEGRRGGPPIPSYTSGNGYVQPNGGAPDPAAPTLEWPDSNVGNQSEGASFPGYGA
jgi:hypothetical protein